MQEVAFDRTGVPSTRAHEVALDALEAGIRAAHPRRVVRDAVGLEGGTLRIGDSTYDLAAYGELVVLGGGKASAALVDELEAQLGDRLADGVVVTNEVAEPRVENEVAEPRAGRVRVLPSDHPTPSERGADSTRALLELADGLDENALVLGAVSGGGSALLVAPAAGLSVTDLRETTTELLESGATIDEINAVRKHLSAVKGGRLAATVAPAAVACLVLSDVVGDDLGTIASGPFVPDDTTYDDALSVLDRYGLSVPDAVRAHLEAGAAGAVEETPKPGDPVFDRVDTHVLANGMTAARAAAEAVSEAGFETGFEPLIVSSRVRGEAREAAKTAVAMAEESRATGHPIDPPAALISGGETTVTVTGDGVGGPNQEFALSAAAELADGEPSGTGGIVVAAVDTDGIDGPTDAAGAVVDRDTIGLEDAREALADNDAHSALKGAGALLRSGPTGTNVNDLRVVVVDDHTGDDGVVREE